MTCHFLGSGRVRIHTDEPGEVLIREIPLMCDPGPDAAEDSTAEGVTPTLAAAAAAPPAPLLQGLLESYVRKTILVSDGHRVVRQPNGTETVTDFGAEVEVLVTFAVPQKCTKQTVTSTSCSAGSCPSETDVTESCTQLSPGPRSETDGILLFSIDREERETRRNNQGVVTETTITLVQRARADANWVFPTVPEGAGLRDFKVTALGPPALRLSSSAGALPVTIAMARTAEPLILGSMPLINQQCDDVVGATSAVWEVSGSAPGNRVTTTLEALPVCRDDGTNVFAGGRLDILQSIAFFEGRMRLQARVEQAMLVLEPSSASVAPIHDLVPGSPNRLGRSDTQLRASLMNAPEGAYQVQVRIAGFDAAPGGHAHGDPPGEFWGSLEGETGSGTDGASADCEITVDASGQGFCEVTFRGERVAGVATFEATHADLAAAAEAAVEVRVAGLAAVPPSPLFIFRGATPIHPENHHARVSAISRLISIASDFHEDAGARLGVDDASIAGGGVFDLNADWSHPHRSHREGLDVDISQFHFDESGEVVRQVACQQDLRLRDAVRRSGASLHCESNGNKHIDFP